MLFRSDSLWATVEQIYLTQDSRTTIAAAEPSLTPEQIATLDAASAVTRGMAGELRRRLLHAQRLRPQRPLRGPPAGRRR